MSDSEIMIVTIVREVASRETRAAQNQLWDWLVGYLAVELRALAQAYALDADVYLP